MKHSFYFLLFLFYSLPIWAERSADAFAAKKMDQALIALFGHNQLENSPNILISAPDIAESGARVRIEISGEIDHTDTIAIFAPQNPNPLIAYFELSKDTIPYIKTNIKMSKTGEIITVFRSKDTLYTTKKTIKVTVGGCGGSAPPPTGSIKKVVKPGASIRMKTKTKLGQTEIKTIIKHPMETGQVKNLKTGELIPAHYIQQVVYQNNQKNIMVANWGTGISRDPYTKFLVKNVKSGDKIKVSWSDNQSMSDSLEKAVK